VIVESGWRNPRHGASPSKGQTLATKDKVRFVCQECGESFPRWEGKCGACGEWNSLVEEKVPTGVKGGGKNIFRGGAAGIVRAVPIPINKVDVLAETRRQTGIEEFDRILGGGLVAGSVTLIGGEPGIGKSTLLLQVALKMAGAGGPSLYVS